jgi:hypothetical protein
MSVRAKRTILYDAATARAITCVIDTLPRARATLACCGSTGARRYINSHTLRYLWKTSPVRSGSDSRGALAASKGFRAAVPPHFHGHFTRQLQNIRGEGQTIDFFGRSIRTGLRTVASSKTGPGRRPDTAPATRRRQTVKGRGQPDRRPPFFARSPRLLSCSGTGWRLPWRNQWSASWWDW